MRPRALLPLLLAACSVDDDSADRPAWLLPNAALGRQTAVARDADGTLYGADGETLFIADPVGLPSPLGRDGLPDGPVSRLFAHDGVLHAVVHGVGLFTATADGAATRWDRADHELTSGLLSLLNPYARVSPVQVRRDDHGVHWLAGGGGLFRSEDGTTWTDAGTNSSGSTNVVFADVAVDGDRVVAVSVLPDSIIPRDYAGILGGRVFVSEDRGASWSEIGEGLASRVPVAVAVEGTTLWVGTMDDGVHVHTPEAGWQALEGGPTDVVGVDRTDDGTLIVGSATRGAWQHDGDVWHQVGDGPVRAVLDDAVVLVDGTVLLPEPGVARREPPEPAGGTVHLALSFHGNFYHSYRGDSPTDDGFGQDIEVIRNTLDWLDARPWVHADWDFDNHWTTDLWMPEHSPDILQRIRARVEAGTDDVRLMSWNNGAMTAMPRTAFDAAISRAKVSTEAAFGDWVVGVQPQENMITPDHIGWYQDQRIQWVTLFYGASGFTGPRLDIDLDPLQQVNPVHLRDPDSVRRLTWVPVYHHADVLEHGGLLGWVRQLHAQHREDTLLVVHFDADAESWERFDLELDAIEGLDFVETTTIADYLADHDEVGEVLLHGDQADGTGDGYQSWAEKAFNHEVATRMANARHLGAAAAQQEAGVPEVAAPLTSSFESRLLGWSTTNYGLAAPFLHPDRVASATDHSTATLSDAEEALAAALPLDAYGPRQLVLVAPRRAEGIPSHGPREFSFFLPGEGIPSADAVRHPELSLEVDPVPGGFAVSGSTWGSGTSVHDLIIDEDAAPEVSSSPPPDVPRWLGAPFTDCGQGPQTALLDDLATARGRTRVETIETWSMPTCGGRTSVTRRIREVSDGLVIEVDATMADTGADLLESVVLTPIHCDGPAHRITWPTVGGTIRTRPARQGVASWNGQHADGWAEVACGSRTFGIAHRVTERTSLGFLPIRNQGDAAMLAPLGALWGAPVFHDGRRTGGHGLADLVVPVVGSQFRPPAADWSGQHVTYAILVIEDPRESTRGRLDAFAWPFIARLGTGEPPEAGED